MHARVFTLVLMLMLLPCTGKAQDRLTVCVASDSAGTPRAGATVQVGGRGVAPAAVLHTTDDTGCAGLGALTTSDEDALPAALARVDPPFPNPTAATATLGVHLERPERIRVDVYDALGRRVRTAEQAGRVGENAVSVDLADVAPGVYVAHVEAGALATAAAIVRSGGGAGQGAAAASTQPASAALRSGAPHAAGGGVVEGLLFVFGSGGGYVGPFRADGDARVEVVLDRMPADLAAACAAPPPDSSSGDVPHPRLHHRAAATDRRSSRSSKLRRS